MRVALAADHNGVALKEHLLARLVDAGHAVDDRGTAFTDQLVDYPALCADVCARVVDGRAQRAVVVGGSGMGEVIACNKVDGIRAGLCVDEFHARISRRNNDANVLVLGAKVLSPDQADRVVDVWFTTAFAGGVHEQRLAQIAALERGEPVPWNWG